MTSPENPQNQSPAEKDEETRLKNEQTNALFAQLGEGKGGEFFSVIEAFLKFIFGILLGKTPDELDDEAVGDPNAAEMTTTEKTVVSGKLIAAGMAQKWEAYKTTHKGETVKLHSPVEGNAQVTSSFGHRHAPKAGASTNHMGVDMVAPNGSDHILAAADGIVVFADRYGKSGNTLVIGHADGSTTIYRHLKSLKELPALGQVVEQGQVVATMGSTGNSTGKHLHFEYHDANGVAHAPKIEGASIVKGATIKGGAETYASLAGADSHRKLPVQDVTEQARPNVAHKAGTTQQVRG